MQVLVEVYLVFVFVFIDVSEGQTSGKDCLIVQDMREGVRITLYVYHIAVPYKSVQRLFINSLRAKDVDLQREELADCNDLCVVQLILGLLISEEIDQLVLHVLAIALHVLVLSLVLNLLLEDLLNNIFDGHDSHSLNG